MNSTKLFFSLQIFKLLPSTRFWGFKRFLLRWSGAIVGQNVRIVSSAKIQTAGHLYIGNETFIGHDVLIVGGDADIIIGENIDIAPRVTIVSGSHQIDKRGDRVAGPGFSEPIEIRPGAWICTGATILSGVTIGEMAIVAAGAVVNKSVPPRVIVAGVPSKIVRYLDE